MPDWERPRSPTLAIVPRSRRLRSGISASCPPGTRPEGDVATLGWMHCGPRSDGKMIHLRSALRRFQGANSGRAHLRRLGLSALCRSRTNTACAILLLRFCRDVSQTSRRLRVDRSCLRVRAAFHGLGTVGTCRADPRSRPVTLVPRTRSSATASAPARGRIEPCRHLGVSDDLMNTIKPCHFRRCPVDAAAGSAGATTEVSVPPKEVI